MDSIPIILQLSGHWDDNSSYVNFQVCGLLIPTNCNYSNLVGMICNELNLQPQLTSMKIEYQVKDGYPPFNIVDDLQLMFYLELKKREEGFTMYPLCLTTEIKNIQPRSFSTWSEITTDDLCVEVAHTEDVASNLFYENMEEGSKEIVADYMDYAELVCGQMVDISTEATSEDEVIEINKDMVISTKHWQHISLYQIYKDKETLQIVLSQYALNNNFQYIVQKSCKKEYHMYPEVPHVFCIFHLLSNIKSKFKKNSKKIKDAFFSAANAYTVKKFEYHMKELDKVDRRVQLFLQEVGYEKWAKVYSLNNRYSNMTSNVAESLNSVTMSIRELPICTMLESLRALVQKWSYSNRNTANATSTRLTTKFEEILKKNYLYSVDLTVHPTNHILFEVHNGERKNVVDLSKRSCRATVKQINCGKCGQNGHNRRTCRNPKKNV
ncbi:hypothetical protein POM88_041130 [Heracleum sosnowskyi]|uniref:CCHC-type domain-containing protein n=1 Tax=Heracleum sosnowskyi TaxID=360622 RepID=A0AAD8MAG6_9APIA|nr:hypothetical protein POM88_041130 [Heracleum sosnowskyi]